MQFTTRTLTPEEVAQFEQEPSVINWGVLLDGEPVVYFSAAPGPHNWFTVGVFAKRRKVHPRTLITIADAMIARMFELGANALTAEIAPTNKASLRLARNTGFEIVEAGPEWVIVRKINDINREESAF